MEMAPLEMVEHAPLEVSEVVTGSESWEEGGGDAMLQKSREAWL